MTTTVLLTEPLDIIINYQGVEISLSCKTVSLCLDSVLCLCDNMSAWLVILSMVGAYSDRDVINSQNKFADTGHTLAGRRMIYNHGMNKTAQISQHQKGKSVL